MTKADLVEHVTEQIAKTAGPMISKKDCARVVDAFLDAIKDALQQQKNIEVRGFGTFKIRHPNSHGGNPLMVSCRVSARRSVSSEKDSGDGSDLVPPAVPD